jgi:hypothetical protein
LEVEADFFAEMLVAMNENATASHSGDTDLDELSILEVLI